MPKALIERVARYHQIASRAGESGQSQVSSAELAEYVGVDATMVRKDMAIIGVGGRPKVGYFVGDLLARLNDVLGLSRRNEAIVIGCGGLGSAIARYPGFARYGLKIVGVFDSDFSKVGQLVGEHRVLPMEKCKSVIEVFGVRIAIITAPGSRAQQLCDWLITRGIVGIWNFAPVDLRVPPNVAVRNENLGIGAAQLIYHVNNRTTPTAPAP